ncbi:MAG: Do family serine endopeptidase [Cyclobacteriaceae bacterium]|nr:Do family serine endopeptidase [Cyclobacteriaceae bacterium]
MNKRNFILAIFMASLIGAVIAIAGFSLFFNNEPAYDSFEERQNLKYKNIRFDPDIEIPEGPNFVYAATLVTPGVVHIKTVKEASSSRYQNPFDEFFNMPRRMPQQEASGSGVIISDDGFIATNYHVVEGATEIVVTLDDNRKYNAKLVGEDPTTDLALIKIDESNLVFIKYGDSDNVLVGEWVLAVGNPFELNSTVTAGIVSAKARNINILRSRDYGIESFIQTDAVVNSGNSGGALVNLQGELIGINTAIASPTGSYTGYSFAVPVSLVKKVMDDLLEFGAVQRALLGISIRDLDADLATELGIKETSGVYVASVNIGSSAEEAGLKQNDIIVAINESHVKNVAELQEHVARNRPGDRIKVTFLRDGKENTVTAILKNIMGEERMYSRDAIMEIQGASVNAVDNDLKKKLDIEGGVQLNNIGSGKWKDAGIKDGFIITSIDKREIKSINDLMSALANKTGGILIGGVYPDGEEGYYGIKWD